jgi:general nucleoside transport system permease protein
VIGAFRLQRRLDADARRSAVFRVLGAFGGLLVAGFFLLVTGRDPIQILSDSIEAIFGSQRGIEGVAVQSIPILMCALGVALSLRMKVWNIGSDGQFLMGAFAAVGIGINVGAPDWMLLVLMAAGSLVGGALWILVPAAARAYWGVNEIITTLLLNFVALQLVLWASLGFWRNTASQVTQSTVPVPVTLPRLPGANSVSIAFLVPLLLALVLWIVFRSTKVGYEIDMIGGNPRAAAFAGIDVRRRVMVVMLISGAIAGLGGMLQLTGAPGAQALSGGFSARYGLSGFIVAALAGASFLGVLVAGIFISALFYAGIALQTKGLSVYIIFAIYGLVLVGVALGEMAARYRLVRLQAEESEAAPGAPEPVGLAEVAT